MIETPLSYDCKRLCKAIEESPELFPSGPFGVSRVQRALKIGYDRAMTAMDEAVGLGILKRGKKPWQCEVANGRTH
jgi:DNA segregation ATPase FtsK/SpoIIIE-like protein